MSSPPPHDAALDIHGLKNHLASLLPGDRAPDDIDDTCKMFELLPAWIWRIQLWQDLRPWTNPLLPEEAPLFADELSGRMSVLQLADLLRRKSTSPNETISAPPQPGKMSPAGKPLPHHLADKTVFVLGCHRSGTTLFRSLLDGHSEIHAPPELNLLKFTSMQERERQTLQADPRGWPLLGLTQAISRHGNTPDWQAHTFLDQLVKRDTGIEKVYQLLHQSYPGQILVDKSPSYSKEISTMRKAEWLCSQRARYLYLHRHPGGTMDSTVRFWEKHCQEDFGLSLEERRRLAEDSWWQTNTNITQFLAEVPAERQHRVSFESLVSHPEEEIRLVCHFLGLDFQASMLDIYDGTRMLEGTGDPFIHHHRTISSAPANAWRKALGNWTFSEPAAQLASSLGYQELC